MVHLRFVGAAHATLDKNPTAMKLATSRAHLHKQEYPSKTLSAAAVQRYIYIYIYTCARLHV